MANFKRKKSRRNVRCTNCTDGREGNSASKGTGRKPKLQLEKRTKRQRTQDALDDLFRPENPNGF